MISELLRNLNQNGVAYALMCALSAWLGKVWASRIARKENAKLQRELTELKHQLEKDQKLLAGRIETTVHVHKAQFEKEFVVYQELMKRANAVRSIVFTLYHSVQPTFSAPEETKTYYDKLRRKFVDS